MSSNGLRRYGVLEDAERGVRPETVHRLTFEDVSAPGPAFRDTSGIVPIESVRDGDAQVLAARSPRSLPERLIDLDALRGYPSVTSVVATTSVQARQERPQITDLLLFGGTPLPDADTFRSLPRLQRVWLTWAQGKPFDLASLPSSLHALGVARHHLRPAEGSDRFTALQRFNDLRQLTLRYCVPKDSVHSIGILVRLVELDCDAPSGWARLRTCTALERVSAIQPRMSNLRSLRTWTRLRDLALAAGAGLRSLEGMDGFSALERLRLVLVRDHDLSPIRRLPRLADVSITMFGQQLALDAFATLPSLRSLAIESAGGDASDAVRVDTLQPLATARTLEALTLQGVVVGDRELAFVTELPALKRLVLSGDFGDAVAELRRVRPDIDVTWRLGAAPPKGERVGFVLVRPPVDRGSTWWIRENLTRHLAVETNYDAERMVKQALEHEDPELAGRVTFDTEADAVCIYASELDARAAASVITGLARIRNQAIP